MVNPRRQLRRLVFLFILLISAFAYATSSHAQSSDPGVNAALKQAAQLLNKKLGKPIPGIDNYSYELDTYPDTGLGCAAPGTASPAGKIQAYKFLITVKGITYDVRVTVDGTQGVVCSGDDIKQNSSLATYRNADFTVLYPDQWSIVSHTSEVFFGLGPQPVCAQPGMLVTALGQVTADKTPDSLIDDYLGTLTNVKASARTNLNGSGRSLIFTAPCTDGSMRQWRISTFIFYGRGYQIVQFVPAAAFNQWSDVFQKIIEGFSPGITSATNNGQPVMQIDKAPSAYIAHIFAGNVYVATLDDLPGAAMTTDADSHNHHYRHARYSSRGDQVAFIDQAAGALYVAGVGGQAHKLIDKVFAAYPPAWSPDNSEIAYASFGDNDSLVIKAVKVQGGDSRQLVALSADALGCGFNTADPAEQVYFDDTDFDVLLAWLPDGSLLYSPGCNGVGVDIVNSADASASAKSLNGQLQHVHISSDGKLLLGTLTDAQNAAHLAQVKISDGSVTQIPSAADPDQTAWNSNGAAIYYSTATAKDTLTLDDPADKDRGTTQLGVWPFKTVTYTVTLHRIDLRTNEDDVLYQTQGRAISHIAPSPDGTGVLFTLVQDASSLVDAFKNNTSLADLKRRYPAVQLYWLSISNPQPQLVAITSDPIWGPLVTGIISPTP